MNIIKNIHYLSMNTNSNNGFGSWVIRFRWLIIPTTLLLVLLAASGGRFLGFATDYRVFFSKDNPQLLAFETLQNTYTKNDNVMFAVQPKDGKVFTPKPRESPFTLSNER